MNDLLNHTIIWVIPRQTLQHKKMSNTVVSRITAISVDPDTHDQPITFPARLKSHVLINRSRKGKERKERCFHFEASPLKQLNATGIETVAIARTLHDGTKVTWRRLLCRVDHAAGKIFRCTRVERDPIPLSPSLLSSRCFLFAVSFPLSSSQNFFLDDGRRVFAHEGKSPSYARILPRL